MATDLSIVEFVTENMRHAGVITFRKMFGEYAVYADGKVEALVCDNQLYVKETDCGRAFIGNVTEAPAYPGARLSFLIEDRFEDREWLSELIRITARELPEPKPKTKKKK